MAKAQAALHLGLRYDQDRPLKQRETLTRPAEAPPLQSEPNAASVPASPPQMPRMLQISQSMTWAQLQTSAPGTLIDAVLVVTEVPAPDLLGGIFLEADEAEPFSAFRRTSHQIRLRWTSSTRIVMGEPEERQVGALVRARGELVQGLLVEAQQCAILTHVPHIIEE